MEHPDVLMGVNNILTIKSAAIMRTISKTFKYYIKVKEYSFYHIFKHLSVNEDSIIEMLFNYDSDFVEQDDLEDYFFPIENHTIGPKIKEYIINKSTYYQCIMDFAEALIDGSYYLNQYHPHPLYELACTHCMLFTDFKPLQGLLIELCVEK